MKEVSGQPNTSILRSSAESRTETETGLFLTRVRSAIALQQKFRQGSASVKPSFTSSQIGNSVVRRRRRRIHHSQVLWRGFLEHTQSLIRGNRKTAPRVEDACWFPANWNIRVAASQTRGNSAGSGSTSTSVVSAISRAQEQLLGVWFPKPFKVSTQNVAMVPSAPRVF
jgi:hypothetical protein